MRNIFLIILIAFFSTGCEKFLDKSPSEGGISGFTSVDQFDALLNEIRVTRNRYEWNHAILGSDDCHFHPDFQTANPAIYQQREAQNVWNEADLKGRLQLADHEGRHQHAERDLLGGCHRLAAR